jgi:hypothetical protein
MEPEVSGFLARLAARQLEPGGALRPRAVSRFAAPEAEAALDEPVTVPTGAPRFVPAQIAPSKTPRVRREPRDAPAMPAPLHPRDAVIGRDTDARPARGPSSPRDVRAAPTDTGADADLHARPPDVALAPTPPAARPAPPARALTPAPLVPRAVVRERTESEPRMAPVKRATPSAPARAAVNAPSDEPVVRITIGRIEVRAAPAPAPVPDKRAPAHAKTLSLDDYLDRRHGPRR